MPLLLEPWFSDALFQRSLFYYVEVTWSDLYLCIRWHRWEPGCSLLARRLLFICLRSCNSTLHRSTGILRHQLTRLTSWVKQSWTEWNVAPERKMILAATNSCQSFEFISTVSWIVEKGLKRSAHINGWQLLFGITRHKSNKNTKYFRNNVQMYIWKNVYAHTPKNWTPLSLPCQSFLLIFQLLHMLLSHNLQLQASTINSLPPPPRFLNSYLTCI